MEMKRRSSSSSHNISPHMPCLQWGIRKLMRCMKVDNNNNNDSKIGLVSARDYGDRRSFERSLIGRLRDVSDDDEGGGVLAATKNQRDCTDAAPKPWNLRTRRAMVKDVALNDGDGGEGKGFSPATNKSSPAPAARVAGAIGGTGTSTNGAGSTSGGEKRKLFSISLTKQEIEEDFRAMGGGQKLPRRPKKRPKIIQKDLDTLFPGLWLTEIQPDFYKVPAQEKTRKR